MEEKENHNKIINKASKEVLKPYGLFKKGQSRTWIDDNGWFLILVEFQPSYWEKGTYLNVGCHYLWSAQDYLSFDYGYREHNCIAFEGDGDVFYRKVKELSNHAVCKVLEYREFRDIRYAMKMITKRSGFSSASKELYNKMMICGLAGDGNALKYARKLMAETKDSQLPYELKYYQELTDFIEPVISDRTRFCEYIKEKILLQRTFLSSKSGFKKLKPDIILP